MTSEIILSILGMIGTAIGGLFGFFASKRISAANAKAKELQNKRTEIDIYQDTISNFDKLLNVRDEAITELKKQLEIVIGQNKELLEKVSKMEREQLSLQQSYKELEKQYKSLLSQKDNEK